MHTDLEIYRSQERTDNHKFYVSDEESQPCPCELEETGVETFECASGMHWASWSSGSITMGRPLVHPVLVSVPERRYLTDIALKVR